MSYIQVSADKHGFADSVTGQRFVPIGSNYCAVMGRAKLGAFMSQVFHLFGTDDDTSDTGIGEAIKWIDKLADLNLNVLRIWLEPDEFFQDGYRISPQGAEKLDRFFEACRERGMRVAVGMHLAPSASGWKLHNFQPPHNQRLLEMLHLLGTRWGNEPAIFSWTIVGEGQLPWYTKWLGERWPTFLQYWYNDNLEDLKKAWGGLPGGSISSFEDAPMPPRNIGACLGIDRVNPGRLKDLPHDPWAGSTWRYDWRMFLEEIGSRRVHEEVRTLRSAGAKQMMTVGANCWTFPNLPAGQMTMGYVPNFYLDSVDYLCQHNYPGPQCLPGGNGDPLSSDQAMQDWLAANQIMGRIYASLGKPVVMEEFGWYGGGKSNFLCPLPERSLEDQDRYMNLMMESMQGSFSGWFQWLHRDMPRAADISNLSGLFTSDGKLKPAGKRYGQWAKKLHQSPPPYVPGRSVVDIDMKGMFTNDIHHETWWQEQISGYASKGPLDFRYRFEPKPMTSSQRGLRGVPHVAAAE